MTNLPMITNMGMDLTTLRALAQGARALLICEKRKAVGLTMRVQLRKKAAATAQVPTRLDNRALSKNERTHHSPRRE